jgi:hypothetical protein
MPTAGRLVGAALFALLGAGVSWLALPRFPEGAAPEWFLPVNAAIGAVLGWRAGVPRGGWARGVGLGLTTAVALALLALLAEGGTEMIERSLRRAYDGPVEALVEMVGIMMRLGRHLAGAQVLTALLLGGAVAGVGTEAAARRLP